MKRSHRWSRNCAVVVLCAVCSAWLGAAGSTFCPAAEPATAPSDSMSHAERAEKVKALGMEVRKLYGQRKFEEALPLALQALELAKGLGEQDPYYAVSIFNVAAQYAALGEFAKAEPLYLQAIAIFRQAGGERTQVNVVWLSGLAELYRAMEDPARAEPIARQSLDLCKDVIGTRNQFYARCLDDMAMIYDATGQPGRAEPLFVEALETRKTVLGEPSPDYHESLDHLADHYRRVGSYGKAEPLFLQALENRRQYAGVHSYSYATSLHSLALLYHDMGNSAKAELFCRQEMEIRKEFPGQNGVLYAISVNTLGVIYEGRGDYAKAEPLIRQAMDLTRKAVGEHHKLYATSLNNLALLYMESGDYAKAQPLYLQALDINKSTTSLNNLALLYERIGNYGAAQPLLRQAIDIAKNLDGEKSSAYATSLNNLATLYKDIGDYPKAEALYRQTTDIYKETLGTENPFYALGLANLGGICWAIGDYVQAEAYYQKSLDITGRVLTERHPNYASCLFNLGAQYMALGDAAKAEPLTRRSLELRKETIGEKHPDYLLSLNNLAMIYHQMGDDGKAEPLFRQAVETAKQALGERHPNYALTLHNLAGLYIDRGDYAKAEPLCRQVIQIRKDALGKEHPHYSLALRSLAMICAATDRLPEALATMKESWEIDVRARDHVLSFGSQRQQATYLGKVFGGRHVPLSLATQLASDADARRFAAEVVLADKGAAQEALARRQASALAATDPNLRGPYEQWRQSGELLAKASMATPGPAELGTYRLRLSSLRADYERAEKALAQASVRFSTERASASAGLETVAATLPDGSALVEFAKYASFDLKDLTGKQHPVEARYLALVIHGNKVAGSPDVGLVLLDNARDIDAATARWRKVVGNRAAKEEEVDAAGADLARLIWLPLAGALDNCHHVYICPDGPLAFVSFAALPGAKAGTFLGDEIDLSYVATGRDLARSEATSDQPPLLVGDADYQADVLPEASTRPVPSTVADDPRHSDATAIPDLNLSNFPPLPGTADEVSRIERLLSTGATHPQILTGTQATETAVRKAVHPSILHLATHGFYLADSGLDQAMADARAGRGIGAIAWSGAAHNEPPSAAVWKKLRTGNAMRRSGIALAGANRTLAGQHEMGGDDGLLTAEEVAGMDLWGTKLVVISACESGLGESLGNEGVFGLRRAFTLAGAQNQVMSLWSVPDRQTSDLMVAMYTHIASGQTPPRALLTAQREFIAAERKAGRYPHPFYWAAFVANGIGAGLVGK